MHRTMLGMGVLAAVCLAGLPSSAQETPAPVPSAPVAAPLVPAPPVAPTETPPGPPVVAPSPAPAAPAAAPSSGLVLLVLGGLATAGGVADLATAPLCRVNIRASAQTACIGTSIAFGAALLGAGVPLLVLGAKQRSAWQDWTKRTSVGAAVVPGGAAMVWAASW